MPPKFVVPHKSPAHRIAAIALYRALVSQSKALQLPAPHDSELQHLIRNRFKQVRHLQSHRRLRVSFEAGYEAIDHLDAAVAGDEGRRAYILDLLSRAPARVKAAPAPRGHGKESAKKVEGDGGDNEVAGQNRPKILLFDRPLPLEQLSGKRHVPVLVDANRIPMLRLKKPQPQHLSWYLSSRIKTRQKRYDRKLRLDVGLGLAEAEDHWDRILTPLVTSSEESNITPTSVQSREPRWTEEIRSALKDVDRLFAEEREKNRVMAAKMQEVVDRERELYEEEKVDAKRLKAIEKLANRKSKEREVKGNRIDSVDG